MNAVAAARHDAPTLVPKFYETRDIARRMLGAQYGGRMRELGAMLSKVAAGRRTGTLDTAQDVVRAADLSGFEAIQVVAAAVELLDPSLD